MSIPAQGRRVRAAKPPPSLRAPQAVPGAVSLWLRVSAASRPQHFAVILDDLAWPEFMLDTCREAACRLAPETPHYRARWYCRFVRVGGNDCAEARLRRRLDGAGFAILPGDEVRAD